MTRNLRFPVLAAAFLAGFPTLMSAGPIADKAVEAETAIDAGDAAAAWQAAVGVSQEVWNATPTIGFTTISLATELSVGFGVYNPRADNKFVAGSPVIIYVEPWGYAFGSAGEGLNSINFAVDLEVLTEAGETLGSLKDLTKVDLVTRSRPHEFNASVTFNLDGISPGKYLLKVTMRDVNSTKAGTFDMPIEIIE